MPAPMASRCLPSTNTRRPGRKRIRSLDNPLPNGFIVGGEPLPITGDYRQTLDMRTSELDTRWTSNSHTVDCITVIHPTKRIVAQRWTLTGPEGVKPLDFDLGIGGHMGPASMTTSDITVGPSKIKGKLMATKHSAARVPALMS